MDNETKKQEVEANRLLQSLGKQIEEANKELDQVNQKLIIAKENLKDRESDEVIYSNKLIQNNREIERLLNYRKSIEQTLDEYNQIMADTDQKVEELKIKREETEKNLKVLEKSIIQRDKEAREELENSLKQKNAELIQVKTDIDRSNFLLEQVRKDLSKGETDKQALIEERKQLIAENEVLEVKMEELFEEIKKDEIRWEETKRQLEIYLEGVKKQQALYEEIDREIREKKEERDTLIKEISELVEKKETAIEEYKVEQDKLFNIARREQHVEQYEAYVKKQFEKAGVTYTEFVPE